MLILVSIELTVTKILGVMVVVPDVVDVGEIYLLEFIAGRVTASRSHGFEGRIDVVFPLAPRSPFEAPEADVEFSGGGWVGKQSDEWKEEEHGC